MKTKQTLEELADKMMSELLYVYGISFTFKNITLEEARDMFMDDVSSSLAMMLKAGEINVLEAMRVSSMIGDIVYAAIEEQEAPEMEAKILRIE